MLKSSQVTGGASLPIGSMAALNKATALAEEDDGSVWLRSGTIETNVSLYPDAKQSTQGVVGTFTNNEWSVGAQSSRLVSLFWEDVNNFWWLLDDAAKSVYKYNDQFVYQGVNTPLTNITSSSVQGITTDGTNNFAIGTDGEIVKYDLNWGNGAVVRPASTLLNGATGLVAFDDFLFVMVSNSSNRLVYKLHKSNGAFTRIPI